MAIICWGNLAKSADSTERIEQAIAGYVETHDENPNAHMGTDYALGAHRLQTLLDHPYGSVKYYHVYDIHAESITAGGIVVKGGGPYMVVQDEAGNERVKIYPEGIIIKQGKIVIENNDQTQIIGEDGIIGRNIFYSGLAYKNHDQWIYGNDDWYPVDDLAFGVYLKTQTPVLIFSNIFWSKTGNNVGFGVQLKFPYGNFPGFEGWLAAGMDYNVGTSGMINFTHILMLYAGANLVTLEAKRTGIVNAVRIRGERIPSTLGYVILGN